MKINGFSEHETKIKSTANLKDYIHAPNMRNLEEKLLFSSAIIFVFDDLEIQKKEMLALVHCNVRSPNPVMHYLLS